MRPTKIQRYALDPANGLVPAKKGHIVLYADVQEQFEYLSNKRHEEKEKANAARKELAELKAQIKGAKSLPKRSDNIALANLIEQWLKDTERDDEEIGLALDKLLAENPVTIRTPSVEKPNAEVDN